MSDPQWSPDRQWWWNGNEWVPASQASAPPPPPPGAGPGPQPTGPVPPARRSGSRKPLLIVGAIVLVLLLGICTLAVANSGSGNKQQAASKPSASAAAPAAAATKAPVADAGSCAPQPCANDNRGWIVNVSDLHYEAPASQFDQVEQGNVFVTLNVTFTNKRNSEQHANPSEFVLLDGAGVKHTTTVLFSCGYWSPVNVTPGASYGPKCLAFQATAGKPSGLILVWTPGGFAGGDYRIKLS